MPEYFLTALENLGNTCYMNCAIQVLFASDEFLIYLLDTKCDKTLHSSLSKLFKDMMECGEKEDSDCVRPQTFRDAFIQIKPEFNNHNQHDSQEFLRLLIDGIHEEVNEAKGRKRPKDLAQPKTVRESWNQYKQYMDDSFLVKIFVGHMSSTIKCVECGHKHQNWDTFWDISLSFPENSDEYEIKELLDSYLADEVLDKDSMVTCDYCRTKRKSIKSLKIERLPLILTINLKRFGNDGHKLSNSIYIEEKLILNDNPYELYACICHRGTTAGGGHYNIFCRYYSEYWYFFDDSSLGRVGDHIYDIREGLRDAYILFYHMKDVTIRS